MKNVELYHRFRVCLYDQFKLIEDFGFGTMFFNRFTSNEFRI